MENGSSYQALRDKAMKEGVEMDGDSQPNPTAPAKEGANGEGSPAPKGTEGDNSASGAANSAATQEPWHKSERFTRLSKDNRELKEMTRQLQSQLAEYKKLMEHFGSNGARQASPDGQVSQQDRQTLLQLSKLLKETPEAAEALGLTSVDKLNQRLQELEAQRTAESFNSELDRTIAKYAEKYGQTITELEDGFREYLDSNEFYGTQSYKRGMVEDAMKAYLFDKQSELAEAAVNKRLIQEKKAKQSNSTESSSKGEKAAGAHKPKNLRDHLNNLIREGGGEIQFD